MPLPLYKCTMPAHSSIRPSFLVIDLFLCCSPLKAVSFQTGKTMGALDYLSTFCTVTSSRRSRKPVQTVEIKVKMDCDGCERKVRNAISSMRGVRSVEVNRKQSRVTVSGHVDPNKVLKRVKNTGKGAEFWPYVPYNLVYYPYAAQTYDKRAPAGYVKNVAQSFPGHNPDESFTSLFSDDNPNACSIM